MTKFVLDTNIVLDLWVFDDPQAVPLREALSAGALRWLATAAMREALRQSRRCWCIFDNTALGEATTDALSLLSLLSSRVQSTIIYQ